MNACGAAAGGGAGQVWVTGIGVVAPGAVGGREAARALREALVRGAGAAAAAPEELTIRDLDLPALVGGKGLRHMSRGTLSLLAAARLALEDAGLGDVAARDAEGTGVAVGTATATAGLVADFDRATLQEGPQLVNPAVFPQTVWNGAASQVAIRHGLRGPNLTVSNGRGSGLAAVVAGMRLLALGRARTVLAGGFEELTRLFRVLLESRGDAVSRRPSEGAVLLVLERRAGASVRGARPLAGLARQDGAAAPGRTWWVGPTLSPRDAAATVDVCAAAGCGDGFSGALAVALAAAGPGSPELVAADAGSGRVEALLAVPAG